MINKYKKIWDFIKIQKTITICTHINSDGDTIGSAVALKHLILDNTNVESVKISGEGYPEYLKWIEANDEVSDEYFGNSLKIVVDTSTKKRIFDTRVITEEAVKIDHHHNEGEWLMQIGGDSWPATGYLIYEMAKLLGLKMSNKAKEAIFCAIWTDTEGLTERNITQDTFDAIDDLHDVREKVLGLLETPKEILNWFKELVKPLKSNENFGYLLIEEVVSNDWYRQFVKYANDISNSKVFVIGTFNGRRLRVGLRSTRESNIDVSVFASSFGGGGHFNSAGCYAIDKEDFMNKVQVIKKEVDND